MTQLVTRIPDELADMVDELVANGALKSRSEAVRKGLKSVVEQYQRAEVGRQIVEGYRKLPADDEFKGWTEDSGVALIEAEPW